MYNDICQLLCNPHAAKWQFLEFPKSACVFCLIALLLVSVQSATPNGNEYEKREEKRERKDKQRIFRG